LNFRNLPDEVIDLTALFVIMFWGQPMVDLVSRARVALTLPDAKDSGVCQASLARFARDLDAGANPPWQEYADVHASMRSLEGRKEITYGEASLAAIETIGRYLETSGVDFKRVRRAGAINKPLVILCALLWAAGHDQ
jgi:hypothetical protein